MTTACWTGTKFNFRNYKDDLEAKVCLLEGKVALNTRQKETILHPDQQALLDKKTGKLFVSGTKAAYSAEWTLFAEVDKTVILVHQSVIRVSCKPFPFIMFAI